MSLKICRESQQNWSDGALENGDAFGHLKPTFGRYVSIPGVGGLKNPRAFQNSGNVGKYKAVYST